MKFALFFFLFFIFINSHATVNMRNGSYTESWVDFVDPQSDYEIKVERFYNSRSLFIGLFGYGWCSHLETHLDISSEGTLTLTECGGGLQVTYYPQNFDPQSPKHTAEAIIRHLKSNKKAHEKNIKKLKKQLMSNKNTNKFRKQLIHNTKMRFEYANQFHLINPQRLKKRKNTFQAGSKGMESIAFNGLVYTRKKPDGTVEKFNNKGKLIQITNPMGAFIKFNYKGGRLAFLIDNKKRRLGFSYDRSGHLKELNNGRGVRVTYRFQGDNLVSVRNMWNKSYSYSYDTHHNLVQVNFPDRTSIKMKYDITKDWIKSYTNRRGCSEHYEFKFSKDDPKNHYFGDYKRNCKGEQTYIGRHEFWYRKYSLSKNKYLHRVREILNRDTKDMHFHPHLGRPITVRENRSYRGYAYLQNGLVNKQEHKFYDGKNQILSWMKFNFKYNLKKVQMNLIEKLTLNKRGKLMRKNKIFLNYNRRGLLTKAKSSDGGFVSIAYKPEGKIASLKNHNQVELRFNYEAGKNKPKEIFQKGVGQVLISYDNQGEVASIRSKNSKQRNIASSVIESFLGMLDFLGPLGETLKI